MTTCVSPVTHGDARSTTTPPNGKSAWSKSGRKSPAPCVPSPAPNTSATYGPTSPPPPNTASISSRHSSNSHPAGRGYPTSTDLISYLKSLRFHPLGPLPLSTQPTPKCPDPPSH